MKIFRSCLFAIHIVAGWDFAISAQTATPSSPDSSSTNAIAPPSAAAQRSEADLEKLVAPIALYPDPLLATLLPASAYPLEIVQAARFVSDTNNIPKLESQKWDENVKAIARFPKVIAQMNENIAWTSDLGDAFINQPKELMDAIQTMRQKAQEKGALKTTAEQVVTVTNMVVTNTVEQQTVYTTNQVVQIQPAQPQVIYVPQYNPTVVYAGSPVAYPGYYYPPPAYGSVAAASVVSFGVGMAVGSIIANNCDWGHGGCWSGNYHGDVNINRNVEANINRTANVNRNANVNRTANANVNRTGNVNAQKWQADPNRLKNSGSTLSTSQTREARGWPSASTRSTSTSPRASTGTSQTSSRASSGNSQLSPTGRATGRSSTTTANRSPSSQSANRSPSSQNLSRPTTSQNRSAFRTGGGSQTRQASSRGSFSRGGGGGGRRR